MGYGSFTKPSEPYYTYRKKPGELDWVQTYFLNPSADFLTRGGSNHQHITNDSNNFRKISFTKDGKSVLMRVGSTNVPVRRYRWVGSRKNRRKQYYIAYITRQVSVTIPYRNFSYRQASRNLALLKLLKPNPLSTTWKEERNGPEMIFNFLAGPVASRTFYSLLSSGFLGGKYDLANASRLTSSSPFSMWDTSIDSSSLNRIKNDAVSSLYEKVAARFPDVGTMVGESKQSLSMLRTLANEGASLVADLLAKDKKRLLGRLKAPADFASNAWLTYVYGVAPLIKDIQSLQELPGQYGLRTYTSKRSYIRNGTSGPHGVGLTEFQVDYAYRVDVRYGVIMSADLKGAQRLEAMNLLNPIGVGYQLIPFSFMVDWFYDLGSFLNNYSALQYGFLYGWETTTIRKMRAPLQVPAAGADPLWKLPAGVSFRQWKEEGSCVRRVLSKTQFPQLPTPKLDLVQDSSIRGLNALAIAVSRHKSTP